MKTAFPQLDLDLSFRPVSNTSPRNFTKAQIEQFNRDGYITGVTLYEGEALQRLQSVFDRHKAAMKSSGFESYHHKIADLYDIVTHPLLIDHLRDLIGPDIICLVSEYICKMPGTKKEVVWHQDSTYNPMDSRSVIVWLAVTDADRENGCMWFIPGAHRDGQQEFDSVAASENGPGGNQLRNAESFGTKIPIELKAGQAVFFSDLLPHWSDHNRSKDRPRGGFTMSFIDAQVKGRELGSRWSVLCCGQDRDNNWMHHPRPG